MHVLETSQHHALAVDPAKPHAFKAPPDDWALFVGAQSNGTTGPLYARVAQPRAGHPPRCRVLGCAKPADDPVHDLR